MCRFCEVKRVWFTCFPPLKWICTLSTNCSVLKNATIQSSSVSRKPFLIRRSNISSALEAEPTVSDCFFDHSLPISIAKLTCRRRILLSDIGSLPNCRFGTFASWDRSLHRYMSYWKSVKNMFSLTDPRIRSFLLVTVQHNVIKALNAFKITVNARKWTRVELR